MAATFALAADLCDGLALLGGYLKHGPVMDDHGAHGLRLDPRRFPGSGPMVKGTRTTH
jgi:hypothetical protein